MPITSTRMRADLSITYRGQEMTNANDLAGRFLTDFKADIDLATGRISDMLLETLTEIYGALEAQHGRPWPLSDNAFGTTPRALAMRTGAGLASIKQSITIRDTGGGSGDRVIEGSISTGLLTVHETGVTITAKRSQYLTIPLRAALDGRGVPLRSSAREWQNTFVARSKAGNLIIFQKDGKNVTPLYLLKSSVYIPPRLQMRQTVAYYADRFGGKLAAAFNDGFGTDI